MGSCPSSKALPRQIARPSSYVGLWLYGREFVEGKEVYETLEMQQAVYEQFASFSRFDFWHRVVGGNADEVFSEMQSKTTRVLENIVEEHKRHGASPVQSLWGQSASAGDTRP